MIDISIVIPVYRTEAFLNQCLDSIFQQENELEIEVICINDESPDGSLAILREYEGRYPDQLRIIDQANTGGATAINNGIRTAMGEYILILDSDDYLLPGSIESLINRTRETGAELVIGKIRKFMRGRYHDLEETDWISSGNVYPNSEGREKLFVGSCYHGKIFKREMLLEDESRLMVDGLLYADGPFVTRIYVDAPVVATLPSDVVVWRKRENENTKSITDRKTESMTLDDHIRSINLSLDNAISSECPAYVEYLASVDSRRPLWHLFPAWNSGDFSLRQIQRFQVSVRPYYQKLRGVNIQRQPRIEGMMVQCLLRNRRSFFFILCLVYYLRTQYRRLKLVIKHGLKRPGLLPTLRLFRKWHPNYLGHDVFRPMLKALPRDPEMFFFESFFGKSYSGNPKYIHLALSRTRPNFRSIWVYSAHPHDIPNCDYQVKRGSDEYFYFLARAKYWVNNIQFPVHEKSTETVYLQTWHGTPLKRLGFDIDVEGPEAEAREKAYRESRNWSYLLAQNEFSSRIFSRCFQFDGPILQQGYPLNSIFYSPDLPTVQARVRSQLGISTNKKVILYAPTWRDNNPIGNWVYSPDDVFDFNLWMAQVPEDYVLLLRYHHLVMAPELTNFGNRIISVSDYGDTQELLAISDCLVTDYSSIFFDYLNRDKPIIYYAYDLHTYTETTRNMYMKMDNLPGPVITNFDALVNCISDIDGIEDQYKQKRQDFYQEFCSNDDLGAAERILEVVLAADQP